MADPGCMGCDISKIAKSTRDSEVRDGPIGGVIHLEKLWALNHYQGGEGFLGWMTLQPLDHHMDFSELEEPELEELGKHLKWVSIALKDYFRERSQKLDETEADPVVRVYISYLFESVFDWPPTKFHLHLHLIPRFQSLGRLLRATPRSSIDAYQIATLTKKPDFPFKYLMSEGRIMDLMNWFKKREQ